MTDVSAPVQPAPVAAKPGKVLAVWAFILAFLPFVEWVAIILAIVSLVQSSKAGRKNPLAVWAIILAVVLPIVLVLIVTAITASLCASGAATCTSSVG